MGRRGLCSEIRKREQERTTSESHNLQNLHFGGGGGEGERGRACGRMWTRGHGECVADIGEKGNRSTVARRSRAGGGGGGGGEREEGCCLRRAAVSWMPVKFPEYYSVYRGPPRDADALGLIVPARSTQGCTRPDRNRPGKRVGKVRRTRRAFHRRPSLRCIAPSETRR